MHGLEVRRHKVGYETEATGEQTGPALRWQYFRMETSHVPPPRITAAVRMTDGLAITFDDGKTAIYSSELLKKNFPEAVDIIDLEPE